MERYKAEIVRDIVVAGHDDLALKLAQGLGGKKTAQLLGKRIISLLKWVVGLYARGYNLKSFKAECQKVKKAKELKEKDLKKLEKQTKEVTKLLKTSNVKEGIGPVGAFVFAKIWKKIIPIFPGLCSLLKGEEYAKKMLAKAEVELAVGTVTTAIIAAWMYFVYTGKDMAIIKGENPFKKSSNIDVDALI